MKKFGSLLLSILIIVSCSKSIVFDYKNNEDFKKIKSLYTPDTRVNIFNVKGIKTGKNLVLIGETDKREVKEELVKNLSAKYKVVIDSIQLLPDNKLPYTHALVNVSVANLRTNPSHPSELATQAIYGTPVLVLKKENDWYLIQTPDKYIAWVDSPGITLLNDAEFEKWQNSSKIIAKASNGLIYASDSLNSFPISDFVAGNIFQLNENYFSKNFIKITLPDKREGFIKKTEFEIFDIFINKNSNISSENLVSTAKQFMGIPYLWGGTSVKGLDCSGFTKTVFFLNGLIIPRDASQQVLAGDKVEIDDYYSKVKPGDLVFFGSKRPDNSDRITHVGMYLGNGKFIHESGCVKIESLRKSDTNYNDFRASSLLQVRRYLNANDKLLISLEKVYSKN
jgi:gamma-D-glutamyl-L-lysine dipeptidyl-peptidase